MTVARMEENVSPEKILSEVSNSLNTQVIRAMRCTLNIQQPLEISLICCLKMYKSIDFQLNLN